jgi:hypothetical protein
MRQNDLLVVMDPVDAAAAQRAAASPAFEMLRREILAGELDAGTDFDTIPTARSRASHRPRWSAVMAAAAAVVVLTGLLVFDHGAPPAKSPPVAAHKSGTWKLADDELSGTWKQYTNGPPPGFLSCPTTSMCYAMSGQFASPATGAPMVSESVYVSTDAGAEWTQYPMPPGFSSTSPISCGGALDCAAGGTASGHNVLATTADGGHTWTLHSLPTGVGHLDKLSCPSPSFCAGLAADSEALQVGATDATFLATNNGGQSFSDTDILPGVSMQSLACSSASACTAIGWNDAQGLNDLTAGVAARTSDGGQSWTPGELPGGLGVSYLSSLACADASDCWMSGTIAISVETPPQCARLHLPQGATSGPIPTSPQSPAVAAIANAESEAASREALKVAASGEELTCGRPTQQDFVGVLASTHDGGVTWTPDPLPSAVPEPQFNDLSCPTANQCWATGSDALPRKVGTSFNGSSPMLLGTTNGGVTWSNVTFSVPEGVPNYEGQSYLSMGSISCPSTVQCVALATGAQSAPSVPTYSVVGP